MHSWDHNVPPFQQNAASDSSWVGVEERNLPTESTLKGIVDYIETMDIDTNQPPRTSLYVVLDTNILLGWLEVIQTFTKTVAELGIMITVLIPGIVITELDYQKTGRRSELQWASTAASAWISKEIIKKTVVRGQAFSQTCQASGRWTRRDPDTTNDDLIVDCCLYFRTQGQIVFAVSADNNLISIAESQGIPTINPRRHTSWSSRDLAVHLLGLDYPGLQRFEALKQTYKPARVSKALAEDLGPQPPVQSEYDEMDIDEDIANEVQPASKQMILIHTLDDFHSQAVAIFGSLLLMTVRRIAPDLFGHSQTSFTSMHFTPPEKWTASDCVEYLCDARARKFPPGASAVDTQLLRARGRRLQDFLRGAYTPGGRRGQEWTTADWAESLEALAALGRVWKDDSLLSSVESAWTQRSLVYELPMRPT